MCLLNAKYLSQIKVFLFESKLILFIININYCIERKYILIVLDVWSIIKNLKI